MEIPASGAWPWLVLGAVLGITLLALIGLGAARLLRPQANRATDIEAEHPAGAEDDLPGFLDSPPGSGAAPVPLDGGWPALSAPPVRTPEREPLGSGRSRRQTVGALVAMATAALLLIGVAAAVAATRGSRPATEAAETTADAVVPVVPSTPPAPVPGGPGAGDLADRSVAFDGDGAAAELTFAGVVLERRAVGVTVAYPALTVTWDGDRALAHLELPTHNCLTAAAPEDPAAAGCTASITEYADLPTPALTVRREGDRLHISGSFATYLRPNGTPPAWTGRVYDLAVTVESRADGSGSGWRPAEGTIRLGGDRVATVDARTGRIRFGD